MILWVLLFILVIGISFILALRSMKDYQEISQKTHVDYGLFLVRQIKNLDAKLLDTIRRFVLDEGAIMSLERLFKGRQTALTIYGPKSILGRFQEDLDFLELEDYTTEFEGNSVYVWEVGTGDAELNPDYFKKMLSNLPQLEEEEQFFWQVIPHKSQMQIRAAVLSKDPLRKKIFELAQNLRDEGLKKNSKSLSNEQMIESYRSRRLSQETAGPILDSEVITRLLRV